MKSYSLPSSDFRQKKSSKYDVEIDKMIIEVLDECKISKKSSELKYQIEKLLGRTISPDTYSVHINKLMREKIVKKDDKGRGKEIFYSISEYGKKLKKLKLLRTDQNHEEFKEIYANLFFCSILEGQEYNTDDLPQLLRDIRASIEDLKIERIDEVGDRPIVKDPINVIERQLLFNIVVHYKDIRNVNIIEYTIYNESILDGGFKEHVTYWYTVPGMSLENFIDRIPDFRPKVENLRRAFELLLDESLIKPCMEFQGETRYIFSDYALECLIKDLVLFENTEQELINYKWSHYNKLSKQELERQKQFFYSERAFNKIRISQI
jgi:DNA-binding transcriptional ArsR family regulator